MTYKTIDWEAEAERVARAFGVEDVHLSNEESGATMGGWINWAYAIAVEVLYSPRGQQFTLHAAEGDVARLAIYRDERVAYVGFDDNQEIDALARALFHLDLLTPEVEVVLNVSISAHEKAEWLMEYDRKFGEVLR